MLKQILGCKLYTTHHNVDNSDCAGIIELLYNSAEGWTDMHCGVLLPLLLCQVEEVEPEASVDGLLPNIGGEGGYFDHDQVTAH